MTKVQRFTWEDALIDAQTAGIIPNGALLVALKLSKAINWAPTKQSKPGLFWKNDDALEAVGCGRASYYRYKDVLFDAGFFTMEGGNLIPTLPESQVETEKSLGETVEESLGETTESQVETKKSLGETEKSQVETEKSLGDNPCSVDICSEDSLSEDECSREADVAAAPSDRTDSPSSIKEVEPALALSRKDKGNGVTSSEDNSPESHLETLDYEALAREQGIWHTYKGYYAANHRLAPGKREYRSYKDAMKQEGKTL